MSDPTISQRQRRIWQAGLLLYALGAGGDLTYHLIDKLHTGDRVVNYPRIVVAFSAALFWPLDIVAMALLPPR